MMETRLIKNTKVAKLSAMKGSVKSTFRRAMKKANDQGWTKVIIIGQSITNGSSFWSTMLDDTRYGMIEQEKMRMFQDDRD